MNSVKCPRCLQVWYSDDERDGSERLCTGCISDLRAAGRDSRHEYGNPLQKKRGAFALDFFLIYVLSLTGMDALLIGLAYYFPEPFVVILLIYAFILFGIGAIAFRWLASDFWSWSGGLQDVDWHLAKWPGIAILAGLVCFLAAATPLFLWH
jgi:hypothetical protein